MHALDQILIALQQFAFVNALGPAKKLFPLLALVLLILPPMSYTS